MLLERPVTSELVCTCRVQPVWSRGHDNVRLPPLAENRILVGLAFTPDTGGTPPLVSLIEPSIFRLLAHT